MKARTQSLSFVVSVFCSAFLLFLLQPLISKYLLPWFGGSASLWATSMVVFQLLLLLGYLYAHVGVRTMTPKVHFVVHCSLIALAVIAVSGQILSWGKPLLPAEHWAPTSLENPYQDVFGLLAVAIGLPYFLLSTTSPLLQYWYGYLNRDDDPYQLYAVSNAGSLIGLLAYPFVFEPLFTIQTQSYIWFFVFLATILSLAVAGRDVFQSDGEAWEIAGTDIALPTVGQFSLWLMWATFPSAFFLAVTNRLSQIAPVVPFLWVLPLAIYLVSLIVCFGRPDIYKRNLYALVWIPAIGCSIVTLLYSFATPIPFHLIVLSFTLFVGCMIGHGELSRRKPHRSHLTAFYLTVAAGGALGGILVSLVAPVVFNGYWEFHLTLFIGMVFVLVLLARDRSSVLHRIPRWFTVPLLLAVWLSIELFLIGDIYTFKRHSSHLTRNFYGVTRVVEEGYRSSDNHRRILKHGQTNHGSQLLARDQRREPTGYYSQRSGVGRAIRAQISRKPSGAIKLGAIGLGAGVLAGYGRPGDVYRFYEINPAVIELATSPGATFTFLPNCPCDTDVIPGDARLSMERELRKTGSEKYDVLVVDVFQNDSPPAHLLTLEAFNLYLKHLAEDGVLAFHVSNRYLKLHQLIHRYAKLNELADLQVLSVHRGTPSRWLVVSPNESLFDRPQFNNALTQSITGSPPIWTDRYANLFSLLKWTSEKIKGSK